jgi:hypothetical protein
MKERKGNQMGMVNKFSKKHGGTYTCRACGKLTRETGYGESGCGLCRKCYDEGGLENEHSDRGHEEIVEGCPTCAELPVEVN